MQKTKIKNTERQIREAFCRRGGEGFETKAQKRIFKMPGAKDEAA